MSERAPDPVLPRVDDRGKRPAPSSIGDHVPLAKSRRRWERPGRIPFLVVIGAIMVALIRRWDRGEVSVGNIDMYVVFALGGGLVIWLIGSIDTMPEETNDVPASHPDPNVQALIDGKIDLEEYSRKQSERKSGIG